MNISITNSINYIRLKQIEIFFLILSINIFCQGNKYVFPNERQIFNYNIKVKVARVIDGDTFVLDDSTRIRLIGIDCPEINRGEQYSNEAKELTKNLVENKIVKLNFDIPIKDIFGRVLAYVFILTNDQKRDTLFLQAELLKKGYARISQYPKSKRYYYIFENLRRTARRQKLGIWGIKK